MPRLLRIVSPLGPDALVLRRLNVQESIGHLFVITAEVLSDEPNLEPSSLIGKDVTCILQRGEMLAEDRYFNGIVSNFSRLGSDGRGYTTYRLQAVPKLWHLGRTGDCRIFQDASVKEIAETIINEGDAAPVRFGASVPTTLRPYCTQFNETDLEFLQRVAEENGCGFFFKHEEGSHTLHVAGANADYPLVPGEPLVVRAHDDAVGGVTQWLAESSLRPGSVKAVDYDGLKPSSLLEKEATTVVHSQYASNMEIFRWPGGQTVRPDGDPAKLLMESAEAGADIVTAASNQPELFAGGRLKVRPGLDEMAAGTWLITGMVHSAFDDTHLIDGGSADYSNSMQLIAADRPWRPSTPRDRTPMPGLQSAIVTGPKGEEIHCDEHGRIKIHFLWDRKGKTDDHSSCWVRVVQGFGGAWGGAWMLPRIGDEVLIGFIEGDIDRPVVVGSLYNAEGKPPFTLPDKKTQTGIKTRSSKKGGADNFNMLMMDDAIGEEMVKVQAEKDMETLVKHDVTTTIKNDQTETIANNRTVTIEQGNDKLTVEKGNLNVKTSLGAIEMEAMTSITLKVGQNKIVIDQSGITLDGILITVKASAMVKVEGPMVQQEASAMMIIKGGLVMIN